MRYSIVIAAAVLMAGLGVSLSQAQPIFQPASGCREAAILTTEQALNPGSGAFTQDRTILPGDDTTVELGAWLITAFFSPDPATGTTGCPASPDGHPLYVTQLKLRPVSGDPDRVGVQTVTFWLDNDFDGFFTPGKDTQFGSALPGSCLTSSQGCVLTFGNAPIFGGTFGLADPLMGGFCMGSLPMGGGGCAAILAVAEVENPQAGATLQVRLEGTAVNLVTNPIDPFGSGFAPQYRRAASNLRVRVEGAPGGAVGGVLSPSVNNGSGNPEGGIRGVQVRGIRTRNDVGGISGTQERDARPGDREYFVGIVALCDGGDITTGEATLLPPVAGVMTIAGGLGAIPCVGPGDGDGFPINVVRVRVGISGPGAQWVQAVHVYADTGLGSSWGGFGTGATLFEPGEQIMSQIPVSGVAAVGSLQQTLIASGGTPLLLGPGGPSGLLYVTLDIDDRAQPSQVTAQVAVDVADIPGTLSSRLMRTELQAFAFQISAGGAPSPSPGPTPGGGVGQFDANGNCRIDDAEFFNAIDRWVSGQIDNALFFDVVDAWISQSDVCVSSATVEGLESVTLKASQQGGITFAARGQGIASLGVQVYDLAGRTVFARETAGPHLRWDYLNVNGRPVANGVYLYVVTVRDRDGRIAHSQVRRLVVLR